jgi:chromosome segregation ATPase
MSDIEKIDEYVDRSAVKGETEFLVKELKTVLDLFDQLNAKKITLNGATSLKDVAGNADATNKAIAELQAQNVKLQKSYDDLAKKLAENKKNTDDLEKAKARLAKTESDQAKEIALVNQQRIENNKQLKIQAELEKASAGSVDFARAKVKELTSERNKLNLTTEEGKQKQAELNKEIDLYNDFIKENVDELAKQKINIGNYPASAKIIVDALEKARQKFTDLSQAADTTPAALDDARRHMESLRGVVDSKQFLNYAAGAGDAQKELKSFTRVLVDLEQRGEGNSEAAIDLRKHLAELTDQIADAKDAVKALASDTHSFDQFAGAVNFAVDTTQTFIGALSLNAESEEDLAEATKTLIALQTVANGVKGIATELTTRGTFANKAYAFAQKQVSAAMDETAAAGARLKGALITIGIGALIIGIGLLIANFDKIKRVITGVSKEQEAYNKIMKDSGNEYAQAVKLVAQLRTNIDLAKQGFIQKEAVIKQYNDSLGKTTGQVKSLDEAEKELVEKGDA